MREKKKSVLVCIGGTQTRSNGFHRLGQATVMKEVSGRSRCGTRTNHVMVLLAGFHSPGGSTAMHGHHNTGFFFVPVLSNNQPYHVLPRYSPRRGRGEERGEGHAKQEAKKQRMRSSRDDEKRAGR
jgi:hypothetical protein